MTSSPPDPSRDENLLAGQMAGEYLIEDRIGEGGMGTVYRASHPVIGKRAAVKVLHSDLCGSQYAVDRFVLEAQAINQIAHPNIVDVFAFGRLEDGRFFFVMELLGGRSLRERLKYPMPIGETIDILDTVARTLQAAHDSGVIHRDLKPDNVFLTEVRDEPPNVTLLDFGLAKLSNPNAETHLGMERTRTGMLMGTPNYLSPEQAKGSKVDHTTDVYSLGAMAYEMVTGQVPFTAESSVEIMAKHIGQPPVPPRDIKRTIPIELDELIVAMLAKEPADRPSLREIRDCFSRLRGGRASSIGIQRLTDGFTVAPTTPNLAEVARLARRSHRQRVLLTALAGLVIAGGIATFVFTRGDGDDADTVAGAGPKPTIEPKPAPKPEVVAEPTQPSAKPAVATVEPSVESAPAPTPKPATLKPATPKPAIPAPKLVAMSGKGSVRVRVIGAPRASLTVDGRPMHDGVVPTVLAIPAGKHTLRASVGEKRVGVVTVQVEAGKTKDVTITLNNLDGVRDPFAGSGKR